MTPDLPALRTYKTVRRSRGNRRGVWLLGLAVFLAASPADAQLGGRLKKLGKDMVKESVKGATRSDSSAEGGKAASSGTSPAVDASLAPSSGADYTITAERVRFVLAALAPAVERARAGEAAKAERTDFFAKRAAYERCITHAGAGAMPTEGGSEALSRQGPRAEALGKRVADALAAKDFRTYVYAGDSLRVISEGTTGTMFSLEAKCGSPAYTPASMLEEQVAYQAGASRSSTPANAPLAVTAPATTALTRVQFGMIRERLALYALMKGGHAGAGQLGKEGVFTQEELAVLDASAVEISTLAPLFKGGFLTWNGAADLKGW